jgi:hypothetical protein
MKTVTIVLNGFKRQHTLKEQIQAFKNQTYPIEKIMYWNLKSDDLRYQLDYNFLKKENIEYAETSHDYGTWGRFSFALNTKSDFICIYDDDIIPGPGYIQNCVETFEKQPGILGLMGTVITQDKGQWIQYGWRDFNNPNPVQVIYLYQSHFFPKEVLQAFWASAPSWDLVCNRHLGEDLHIAFAAKKYFNLNAYVVPHPKNNKTIWGNIAGDRYGEDEHSIHLSNIQPKMLDHLQYMINNHGYQIPTFKNFQEALRYGEWTHG